MDEMGADVVPPSRPMTPSEQLNIMRELEYEETCSYDDPSDRDMDVG